MKPLNYSITKEQFAQILRDFRAYGTPVSCSFETFGNFTLVKDSERTTYHLVFACADGSFVAEIMPKLELVQVVCQNFKPMQFDAQKFFDVAMNTFFPSVKLVKMY